MCAPCGAEIDTYSYLSGKRETALACVVGLEPTTSPLAEGCSIH